MYRNTHTHTHRSPLLRLRTETDRNSPETAYVSCFDSLGTMCWQCSISARLTCAIETELKDNRFVVKAICRVTPKSKSVPIPICRSDCGLQNESQTCGDPQHPEASVTYLTSFTQTRPSTTDLTE